MLKAGPGYVSTFFLFAWNIVVDDLAISEAKSHPILLFLLSCLCSVLMAKKELSPINWNLLYWPSKELEKLTSTRVCWESSPAIFLLISYSLSINVATTCAVPFILPAWSLITKKLCVVNSFFLMRHFSLQMSVFFLFVRTFFIYYIVPIH